MNAHHCVCLVFLAPNAVGRIERYESCPQHWRQFDGEFEIPRESTPVDLDDFLDLIDA